MRLLVYLRDGRTVYMLKGRGVLRKLVEGDPWHEHESVLVMRGIWNPTLGEYGWAGVPLRHIAKQSISVVEEVAPGEETPAP